VFKWGKNQNESVFIIRDSRSVEDALRQALETADADERAGLQRALTVVEQTVGLPDVQVRRRWVRDILNRTGVDAASDSVNAVKVLRQAVPGLSLAAAYQLVKDVAENPA
jgi:DNA-binding phage protein